MEIALTTRVPLLCRSRILSPSSLRIASRSGVREILSCRERRVSRITSLGLSSRERSMSTTLAYATSESDRPSGGCADRLAVVFDFGLAPPAGIGSSVRLSVVRVLFRKISSAQAGALPRFAAIQASTISFGCNSVRPVVYTMDSSRVRYVY